MSPMNEGVEARAVELLLKQAEALSEACMGE
jgi:hypothetical protein